MGAARRRRGRGLVPAAHAPGARHVPPPARSPDAAAIPLNCAPESLTPTSGRTQTWPPPPRPAAPPPPCRARPARPHPPDFTKDIALGRIRAGYVLLCRHSWELTALPVVWLLTARQGRAGGW